MSDSRIRQEPPNADLDDRGYVTQYHRGRGQNRHHRNPTLRITAPGPTAFSAGEAKHHYLGKNKEARDLRTRSDERSAGDRRPLIGIWRPKVERNRSHLEPEPDHGHNN